MEQRTINMFIGILLLVGVLIWINTANLDYVYPASEAAGGVDAVQSGDAPWWTLVVPWQGDQQRSIRVHQGLDLQGGLQVVLEADLPPEELQEGSMEAARVIVDNRVNGLGVTEPLVQLQGSNRMIVELPGISDPDLAIRTLRETGLLEFVDAGSIPIPEGTVIKTTFGEGSETSTSAGDTEETVYETIITGSDLAEVSNAGFNPNTRAVEVNFSINSGLVKLLKSEYFPDILHFKIVYKPHFRISCAVNPVKSKDPPKL